MSTTSGVTTNLSDLPAVGSGAATTAGSSALGKDEFMKLLTYQLQHQDPLKPVDNTEMIAQLAQFSQLEELHGLSGKVESMMTAVASASQLQTTDLVGKQALFHADHLGLVAGATSTFQLSLGSATADTTAVLTNGSGTVVRTLHLGPRAGGTADVTWDGLDDAGKPLPSGEYVLSVSGTLKDGSSVPATANVRATITGVAYDQGVAHLVVAGRHIALSDVVEISSAPSGS